jgi:hypothetical protein
MMFEEKTTQEALDFWGGTLADVKEEKMLIPPTTNVKLQVYETKVINQNQDGTDRNWKMLVVRFKIVDGVEVGNEVKYKIVLYKPKQCVTSLTLIAVGMILLNLSLLKDNILLN